MAWSIVNPQNMQKEDFVKGGTATGPMLDFLAACLRYGVSVCVAGATGSGKTTVAGWLLTTIPDNKRIFTIENGSRELDLVREKDGRVCNSVIHTITRESENAKQNIDQDMLLDMALRYHPDIICVGEMRSAEAYAAQEAARTGHGVLTTIHSNSSQATWRRMVTLCKRKHEMADDTAGLLVLKDHALLGLGLMLSAGEVPRICGAFGLDTSTRANIMSAVYAAQSAVNTTRTVVQAVGAAK